MVGVLLCLNPAAEFALGRCGSTVVILSYVDLQITTEGDAGRPSLAKQSLPEHSHKFSRKDFTLPQLFACLVIREHQKKSYRGTEALLADSPDWLAGIGMSRAPDHNTLWRAFTHLVKPGPG